MQEESRKGLVLIRNQALRSRCRSGLVISGADTAHLAMLYGGGKFTTGTDVPSAVPLGQ